MTPATLASAALDAAERRALDRFVELLRERYGDDLDAVWLFGSRARGERTHEYSDVDLLVLLRQWDWEEDGPVFSLGMRAAEEVGARATVLEPHLRDRAWVEDRRAIRSFFIREVDRDKIVLYGEP